MLIRKALPEDAATIYDVHVSAIRDVCGATYEPAQIAAWIASKRPELYVKRMAERAFFVAESARTVIGFYELDAVAAEVCAIFVHPSWLRRGVGRALLQHLELTAGELGLTRLTLQSSINAVPFYRGCGYAIDGPVWFSPAEGAQLPSMRMYKQLATPK